MKFLWARILGAIVLEYLIAGLFLGGLALFGQTESVLQRYAPSMIFAGVIGLTLSIAILIYASRWGGLPLREFGFSWNRQHATFSISVTLLIFGLAALYMFLLDRIGFRDIRLIPPQWGVLFAAVVGALSILHEEILSRGYILTVLNKRYGVTRALFLSAVIFMLLHVPTRGISYQLVTWFGMGLVFGYVYLKSGSLWVSLAVHAAHNFFADLLLYSGNGFAVVEFDPVLGAAGQIPFRILIALVVIPLAYVWYGRGERFLKPAPNLVQELEAQRS